MIPIFSAVKIGNRDIGMIIAMYITKIGFIKREQETIKHKIDEKFDKKLEGLMVRNLEIFIKMSLVLIIFVSINALAVGKCAAAIANGKHDLSISGGSPFKYATTQTCVFCHTPHGANVNQAYTTDPVNDNLTVLGQQAPNGQFLWNRKLPLQSWDTYTSDTMNHTVGGPGMLSLLCLSCHDGVGALNVLLNYPSSGQPGGFLGVDKNQFGDVAVGDPDIGPLNIGEGVCDGGMGTNCNPIGNAGKNLQNDHPIGFLYLGSASGDTGLKDSLPAALERRMEITNRRLECSTCHDPHLTNTASPGNMFLVISTGSDLCFGCHNK